MINKISLFFYSCILALFILPSSDIYGQTEKNTGKPGIDTGVLGKWPRISYPKISNDGKYTLYSLINTHDRSSSLIIKLNSGNWGKNILGLPYGGSAEFSEDSHEVYFMKSADTMGVLDLKARRLAYSAKCLSFKLSNNTGWIAILSAEPSGKLVLRRQRSQKGSIYEHVSDYEFSPDGRSILITTNHDGLATLRWLELASGKSILAWAGGAVYSPTFNAMGDGIAFLAANGDGIPSYSIYWYKFGATGSIKLADDHSLGSASGYSIANGELVFNNSGAILLFQINKAQNALNDNRRQNTRVIVWKGTDQYTQDEQHRQGFKDYSASLQHYAVVNLETQKVIVVNPDDKKVLNVRSFDRYLLMTTNDDAYDAWYNIKNRPSCYLFSAVDGHSQRIIEKKELRQWQYSFSPDERFLVWFDKDSTGFFSYETATGRVRNISKDVPTQLYDYPTAKTGQRINSGFSFAGWSADGNSVYLYDNWDIWRIDLSGKTIPENITHGTGKKNDIVFGICRFNYQEGPISIKNNDVLLLSAFSPKTKANGFWRVNLGKKTKPEMLSNGPYCYYIERLGSIRHEIVEYGLGSPPIRAKNQTAYVILRKDASSFPNLFFTTNFKTFSPISDIHPEKDYNWLTAELMPWKMSDGEDSQGILYKPENFDPHRRYPVIFEYYNKLSDNLHTFLYPDWQHSRIDIPYYVSNGYLVFTPDIHFKVGHDMDGVVNSVVSAAHFLSKLPYVDSTKLGIQGHSFGGSETDFLITQSNLFAAACSSSGNADVISAYDESIRNSTYNNGYFEISSNGIGYGLGVTPWTRPDLYIKNTSIFYIGQITAPLLITYGDQDGAIPRSQPLEIYYAMRRAGKRVWLLEYKDADHNLLGDDAKDMTIRVKQFFDYYLKGAQPPVWMTKGIPASREGIDDGLELDISGEKP